MKPTKVVSGLVEGLQNNSLGSLCHKPEAFEISRMFVNMYVCISPNLPRFRGPGIEVLKFYSTRVERFRKKNLSLEMNRKYPKDHLTVDKVGCRQLIAEKSCFV